MAGLFILAIMVGAFILLDVASLRWGVDSRSLDLSGRRPGPLGTR
jgi:hypothetical protein